MFRKRNRKMQCGFCTLLSNLLRSLMCIGSRRGSTDSYYRELADQDTLKAEDRSDTSDEEPETVELETTKMSDVEREYYKELAENTKRDDVSSRFLTLHRLFKRRPVTNTRSLLKKTPLIDDSLYGQVQYILNRSVLWHFNVFTLDYFTGGRCLPMLCVHLFHMYGLMRHFNLDPLKVWKLFSLIEAGYHSSNPYHTSVHAVDVTQAMHCFLQQDRIRQHMKPLEILAALLAAITHDLDHPGVSQPFLVATSNHLARLYRNTSVLENHHWRSAVSCILESRILSHLAIEDSLERLFKQISVLILATDISRQQEYLTHFRKHLDEGTLDMTLPEHRQLILQIALKCADISNPCRPWRVSSKWSLRVCDEFFRQGDYERSLKLPITALCDRHGNTIPRIQTGFFTFVVNPLMQQWHRFLQNDLSKQMMRNLRYNQNKWEMLAAEEAIELKKNDLPPIEIVDLSDDEEDEFGSMSDSAEKLLPLRRRQFTKKRSNLKREIRRYSAPLSLFEDSLKRKEATASTSVDEQSSHEKKPSHSEMTVKVHCERPQLSETQLKPDSTIAIIKAPSQVEGLRNIREDGATKLVRQQTFPPLETVSGSRVHFHRELFCSIEEGMSCVKPETLSKVIMDSNALEDEMNNVLKANKSVKGMKDALHEEKDDIKGIFTNSTSSRRRKSAPMDFQSLENSDCDNLKLLLETTNFTGRRDSAPVVSQIWESSEVQCNVTTVSNTFSPYARYVSVPNSSQVPESCKEKDNLKIKWNTSKSTGRRESAPTGYRLCENLASIQISGISMDERIHPRRKSMPADVMCAPGVLNMTAALPDMLRRTLTAKDNWARRRGSAPVPLVASDLAQSPRRTGSRHKQTLATCQLWISKPPFTVQEVFPVHRRSSLPAEVYQRTEDNNDESMEMSELSK